MRMDKETLKAAGVSCDNCYKAATLLNDMDKSDMHRSDANTFLHDGFSSGNGDESAYREKAIDLCAICCLENGRLNKSIKTYLKDEKLI